MIYYKYFLRKSALHKHYFNIDTIRLSGAPEGKSGPNSKGYSAREGGKGGRSGRGE